MPKPTPVRQNCWNKGRPSFETDSAAAAAEEKKLTVPQQSAFQAQLDAMERQRAAMKKENDDFNTATQARAETQAHEMAALMTGLPASAGGFRSQSAVPRPRLPS